MQIDRRLFEVTTAEQDLDGAQIGTGFRQGCGDAMPQHVRVKVLMCERRLALANMFGPKLIGTAMEVLAEVLHAMNVEADRGLGEVATLQLLTS
jgi:hypothetical protein